MMRREGDMAAPSIYMLLAKSSTRADSCLVGSHGRGGPSGSSSIKVVMLLVESEAFRLRWYCSSARSTPAEAGNAAGVK